MENMDFSNSKANYYSSAGYQCLDHLENTSTELYLSTCGIQSCSPGHFFGPDKRDIYIIHFICEGSGIYRVNGVSHNLSKGDFFVIFPNDTVYYEADHRKPWDYLWIGFGGIKAETYLKHAGITREKITGRYINSAYIMSNIQQMIIARTLTYQNELRRQSFLLQVLASLIEEYEESLPAVEKYCYPNHVYLQQAFDYIASHVKDSIRVNEIAEYIGINRSYLTKIFKSAMDISPQEYLLTFRLDKAADMLVNTDYKVNYIANCVGYSDPLAFTKMFKQYKNMSPTDYRNNNINNKE